MCVYIHVVCICICYGMHVNICYNRSVLCFLVCKCSRPILHHVGCSGFTKLGSGSLQNMLRTTKHAHGRGEADHGRDEQGEEHPVISSRP